MCRRELELSLQVYSKEDCRGAMCLSISSLNGRSLIDLRSMATMMTPTASHFSAWRVFDFLGLQTHKLDEEGYDEVNFMARGIYHATLVNTVSPTYAREIIDQGNSAGLGGLLQHRHFDLHGILNGLDYDVWDPATDKNLASNFDYSRIEHRLLQ